MLIRSFAMSIFALLCVQSISAQISNPVNDRAADVQLNTITTAVPFLQIAPDSRSGALGDAGVALSPDAASIHWNAAKMGFAENEFEVALSYSPWLRALVDDMNLAYLSGYRKINKNQAVGGALRYFSLGEITLSDKFSGGIAARFINSNLTGGITTNGSNTKPGRSFAVDVSAFYTNDDVKLGDKDAIWNWGVNISNIGAKINYTDTQERDFIPANLRVGTALTLELDEYNDLTFTFDANKLLVPTPAKYDQESGELIAGIDPDVGVATALIQSFYDAPGNVEKDEAGNTSIESGSVFREELREINLGGGVEYWYDKQFAFRTGYFFEHYTKGNRQFITLGAGLKYSVLAIDMSYLISTTQQNPLANTLRFSLRLEFADLDAARSEG